MFSHEMLGIQKDVSIFQYDHNSFEGGVSLVISNKLLPMKIHLKTDIELVVAKVCYPIEMYIMSVYRSPAYHMCNFAKSMTKILKEFRYLQTCVVGDNNEDILLTSDK